MDELQLDFERTLQLLRDLDFRSHTAEDCERRDELLIQLSRQDPTGPGWDPRQN